MKRIISEKELINIYNNCPFGDCSRFPKHCNKFNSNCMEHCSTCDYIRTQTKGALMEITIKYGNETIKYYV